MLKSLRNSLMLVGVGAAMLIASPANAYAVYNFYDGAAVVGALIVGDNGAICPGGWGRTTPVYVIVYSAPGNC